MDLLTNAVESLQVGIEDYQVGTRPRLLSAVRNIHAGILLLYKEALRRLSPPGSDEALVKAKVLPQRGAQGKVLFVGKGKKTVDVRGIRERFEQLGISTNWKALNTITGIRNDIEHYYRDISKGTIESTISEAYLIVRAFLLDELDEDPGALLGPVTWRLMLEVNDVYRAELRECQGAMATIPWRSETLEDGVARIRCEACGSGLLVPKDEGAVVEDVTLVCRQCGNIEAAASLVSRALDEVLAEDRYLTVSDGADEPLAECPQCNNTTYVIAEGRCAFCGESVADTCDRCGQTIPPSELRSSPLCGYCDHMMSKDD